MDQLNPVRPSPPRARRRGMGLLLLMVAVLFGIVCLLLLTHFTSAASVAHERKLSFHGTHATIACRNALNEAFYHFISRANSPDLSEKAPVDLYQVLRDLSIGGSFSYEVPPPLTRRLMQDARISISKVEVEVASLSSETTQVATSVTRTPIWPAATGLNQGGASTTTALPAGWTGRPGAAAPSGACDLTVINFTPRVSTQGIARFTVTASIDGPRSTVSRTLEVRKGFTVIDVNAGGDLALVRLTPNDVASFVHREVKTK